MIDKTIDGDIFRVKETELKNEKVNLELQLREAERLNPNFEEVGYKTLELCNSLYPQYLASKPDGKSSLLKMIASNYQLHDASITATYRKPFSFFNKKGSRPQMLPEQDSKRTNSRVVTEEIPYHYKWHNKTKTLFRGPKPDFIAPGKIITKREQEHHDFIEAYENPIEKALSCAKMMQEEYLSQNSLAKKLGISRVRVTQILNLLKLPPELQEYILAHGREKQITERSLRKNFNT